MEIGNIDRKNISSGPGVYVFLSPGKKALYIGKAKNLRKRIQHYFTPSALRKQEMINKAKYLETINTNTEREAILLEEQMIRKKRPPYNNLVRGETSYIYIKISNESFPRITLTRRKKDDRAIYIGPKVRNTSIKKSLSVVKQILQYRSCSKHVFSQGKLCSEYFFSLCRGRCIYAQTINKGRIGKACKHQDKTPQISFNHMNYIQYKNKNEALEAYKNIVRCIVDFFCGKNKTLLQYIEQQIQKASKEKKFERAVKLRDIYYYLIEKEQKENTYPTFSNKNGIFVLLLNTGENIHRIVASIVAGKIIDIIQGVDDCKEMTLKMIEEEYNVSFTQIEQYEKYFIAISYKNKSKKFTRDEIQMIKSICIQHIKTHPSHTIGNYYHVQMNILSNLQKRYNIINIPYHIECIDISHFSGSHCVGGLSCMKLGSLDKTGYRRYYISKYKNNDLQALQYVIEKRFLQSGQKRPDLFIIDGGKEHLNIINELKKTNTEQWLHILQTTTFLALGKGNARGKHGSKTSGGIHETIFFFSSETGTKIQSRQIQYDEIDKVLIILRDEAHRFANQYRKQCMKKELSTNK